MPWPLSFLFLMSLILLLHYQIFFQQISYLSYLKTPCPCSRVLWGKKTRSDLALTAKWKCISVDTSDGRRFELNSPREKWPPSTKGKTSGNNFLHFLFLLEWRVVVMNTRPGVRRGNYCHLSASTTSTTSSTSSSTLLASSSFSLLPPPPLWLRGHAGRGSVRWGCLVAAPWTLPGRLDLVLMLSLSLLMWWHDCRCVSGPRRQWQCLDTDDTALQCLNTYDAIKIIPICSHHYRK